MNFDLKKAILGGAWWVGALRAVAVGIYSAWQAGQLPFLPGWVIALIAIIAAGLQAGEPNK